MDGIVASLVLGGSGVLLIVLGVHFQAEENCARLRRAAAVAALIVGALGGLALWGRSDALGRDATAAWLEENAGPVLLGVGVSYLVTVVAVYLVAWCRHVPGASPAPTTATRASATPPPAAAPAGGGREPAPAAPRHCPRCKGSGQETKRCAPCGGAGEFRCTYYYYYDGWLCKYSERCEGGRLVRSGGMPIDHTVCGSCNGRGFHRCSSCAGAGHAPAECGRCGGKGEV